MKTCYLLANCNEASKTTATFTLIPGLLDYGEASGAGLPLRVAR